jgi:hypothetical protein
VTAVGTQGEATATGSDVRRALDLRSTWFRIGVLSLSSPAEPVTSGKKVALSGVARSMPSVKLEQRTLGTAWSAVGAVAPGAGGKVRVATRPRFPTDFRLVSGDVRSRVAHVKVAPLVRFRGIKNARTLRGYARPIFEGAVVSVQRFDGSRWRTVGRGGLDASGDFLVEVTLSPGSYRARLAPGHGFVAGVSPTLKVGPA